MVNKVLLVKIEGWGHNEENDLKGDAIKNTKTPWMSLFEERFPSFLLLAHGEHVGLPPNQMGNSEVGHLTIGSGRVIEQDIVRINREISEERMRLRIEKPLQGFINEKLHIIGLLSNGGVHSHINHIKSLVRNVPNKEVCIHAICDGRDTSPKCFLEFYNEMQEHLKEVGKGKIVSIAGRYYTMDRDKRTERIDAAFKMMTKGKADTEDIVKIINRFYGVNQTDEFIPPTPLDKHGHISKGEPIIFANFRADRMRQIVEKFQYNNPCFTMTEYSTEFKAMPLFPKIIIENTLPEVISQANLKQIHIAETEKYAHVTYFLNGGNEEVLDNEFRVLVKSPLVKSYDLEPEMSTFKIVEEVYKSMKGGAEFIVCNIAAPDMVGHTGDYEMTCEAIAATDEGIGLMYEACKECEYTMIITSDHGNAEVMKDKNNNPVKKHTLNRVPFILCHGRNHLAGFKKDNSSLKDVAPTILNYMGLKIPAEMAGVDLMKIYNDEGMQNMSKE